MKVLRLAALACLALVAGHARGELITFAFEGTVTSVRTFWSPVGPESLPAVGDPFRGSYIFDSDAVNTSSDPFSGRYTTIGVPRGILVQVGQFELEGIVPRW